MFKSENIRAVAIHDDMAIEFFLNVGENIKTSMEELYKYPLRRIPLFNVAQDETHPFSSIVKEYINFILEWKVTFFKEKQIDIEKEREEWNRSIRVTRIQPTTLGLKQFQTQA